MLKYFLYFALIIFIRNGALGQIRINNTLVKELNTILDEDQKYRLQIEGIKVKYGNESKELHTLYKTIREKDSVNLIKVRAIIDKYGWLGANVIGEEGSTTLFLVIQHSALPIQLKYLPLMKAAVKTGHANASSFALLEDRVAVLQKKKQLYGTQVGINTKTNEYFVFPIIRPEEVDLRRSKVGLSKLATYLKKYNIKWDITEYKKNLPRIEATLRKYNL